MRFLKKLLFKSSSMPNVMEFIQAKHFKGFKKIKITNYQFPEAEANLKKLKSVFPKMDFVGCIIRLERVKCSDGMDAVAVFVSDLRIGTIFFNNGNYSEFKQAFDSGKISAACVRVTALDDYYLLAKLEE